MLNIYIGDNRRKNLAEIKKILANKYIYKFIREDIVVFLCVYIGILYFF